MEKIWSQLLAQEATISQTLNSHLTYLSPPCCRLGSVSPAATAAYLSLGSGNVDIWQNILNLPFQFPGTFWDKRAVQTLNRQIKGMWASRVHLNRYFIKLRSVIID